MTPKERIDLAYKVTERMKLMPFLKEEIEAVLFSLYLVREEDL